MSRPRAVFKPLDVFWLMVADGSQAAVAKRFGVSQATLRRHAEDDIALQFALDAGRYEYRRRCYPHGNVTGYHQGCRCEACTKAASAYKMRLTDARAVRNATDAPHGTVGGYRNWKCRCTLCTAAHSNACKAYYQSRREEGAAVTRG